MDHANYNFAYLTKRITAELEKIVSASHYDQFFTFRKIGKAEFYDFLFNDEHLLEINNDKSSLKLVLKELWRSAELPNELFDEIIEYSTSFRRCIYLRNEDNKNNDETTFYRTLLKCVLYSALTRDFRYPIEHFPKSQICFAELMNSFPKNKFLFRGQSDFSWEITPSLIRNLNIDKDLYINQNTLFNMYNEDYYNDSLLSKYNKCFMDFKVDQPAKIDYRFLSWMQHAVSFSPLVDFTSDYNVALTFALSSSNPNTFMHKDSAIYILNNSSRMFLDRVTSTDEANEIISKINISALNKRITPGDARIIKDAYGNSHKLDFTSYDKIYRYLSPKFLIIDIPTNDRMLVQKGKFILYYDYLLIDGKIVSPFGDNIENMCYKHRISAKEKPRLLNWLHQNYPEMKESYLMDPYLIFRDWFCV